MKEQNTENNLPEKEETRAITAAVADEIEDVQNDVENLAALVYILAQSHYDRDGAPNPKLTGQALDSIGSTLEGISKKLDLVMSHIYKGEQ